jgi:hypothetical protein
VTEIPELDSLIKSINDQNQTGSELDRVAAAVEMNKALSGLGDQLISHFVEEARSIGRSWTEIGDVLGVSKQGAHQRFGRRLLIPASLRREMGRMYRESKIGFFERFSDSARRVMVESQIEARRLKHNYLGTEHILLGLLVEGGQIREVLAAEGASVSKARTSVESIVGPGNEEPTGSLPFTPRAKRVIELALREALKLRQNVVSSEHLLLGLLVEGEGVGAQVLKDLGVSREKAETAVRGTTKWGRPGDTRAESAD